MRWQRNRECDRHRIVLAGVIGEPCGVCLVSPRQRSPVVLPNAPRSGHALSATLP